MRSGPDRKRALEHAFANAKDDRRPRYVWVWAGDYWIDTIPPAGTAAGVYPENVTVVYPEGHTEQYSDVLARQPKKG